MYASVWINNIEGTRQNNSVTSGERVLLNDVKILLNLILFWVLIILKCHKIGGGDCLLKTQDNAK